VIAKMVQTCALIAMASLIFTGLCSGYRNARCKILKVAQYGTKKYFSPIQAKRDWRKAEDELAFERSPNLDKQKGMSESLFDSLYRSEDPDDTSTHSISQQSLRDISESYQFSLAYLGDFVAQMGCAVPIDVDTNIANILTGEQIYSLLQALTSLDPFDSNIGYDTISIAELADELQVPISRVVKMCHKEKFNLPFGTDTSLHSSVVEHLRKVAEYDEYRYYEPDHDEMYDEDGQMKASRRRGKTKLTGDSDDEEEADEEGNVHVIDVF